MGKEEKMESQNPSATPPPEEADWSPEEQALYNGEVPWDRFMEPRGYAMEWDGDALFDVPEPPDWRDQLPTDESDQE
jgi:hypothetical protein